jgi:hypothetical protein
MLAHFLISVMHLRLGFKVNVGVRLGFIFNLNMTVRMAAIKYSLPTFIWFGWSGCPWRRREGGILPT